MSLSLKHMFSRHGNGRISIAWSRELHAQLLSGAATTSDGRIIVGTKEGKLFCLTQEGEEEWAYDAAKEFSETESYFMDESRANSISAPPLVADVDGDGTEEILVGTGAGQLCCISLSGKLLWRHECGGSIRAQPAIADINMDGHPEILVTSINNKLTALTSEGKLLFEYMTEDPLTCTPGVLKRKQQVLIIFGTAGGNVLAIAPSQETRWSVDLGAPVTAAPAFFSAGEEERFVIGTHDGSMHCISEHGKLVWTFKTQGSIYGRATITDLDNDGIPEILFGSCDNSVYAITISGKKIWSYETDFWVTQSPVAFDFDDDGKKEVVFGSYDHSVYVLDGLGTYVLDYVPGLSGIVNQAGHYTNMLTSDPGEHAGKKIWQFRLGSIIVGCAMLEGREPTIVVSTKDGKLTALRRTQS